MNTRDLAQRSNFQGYIAWVAGGVYEIIAAQPGLTPVVEHVTMSGTLSTALTTLLLESGDGVATHTLLPYIASVANQRVDYSESGLALIGVPDGVVRMNAPAGAVGVITVSGYFVANGKSVITA